MIKRNGTITFTILLFFGTAKRFIVLVDVLLTCSSFSTKGVKLSRSWVQMN